MKREPVAGKRESRKQKGRKVTTISGRRSKTPPREGHTSPSLSHALAFACLRTSARPAPPPSNTRGCPPPIAMETAFGVAAGDGAPTAANLHAAGIDVLLQVAAEHWLAVASGGATRFRLREVEVAFTASFYFAQAALPLTVNQHAWSLPQLAASLQTALDHGLSADNRESVRAALHYFVVFCRTVRAQHPSDFTVGRSTAFMILPAHAGAALAGDSAYTDEVTFRRGVDASGTLCC